jgi:hypothetical protein
MTPDRDVTSFADRLTALEAAYGAPSQAAFGSSVFSEILAPGDSLEQHAGDWYRHFLGDRWTAVGEEVWMGSWKEVHRRPDGAAPDIVAELRAITDPDARVSAPMILDVVEDAERARAALTGAFDDPSLTELRAFNLGDGAAMSGILVAGRAGATGDAVFLVFLLD